MFTLQKFISYQLLPPAILCYLLLVGIILCWRNKRRPALTVLSITFILWYGLSLPPVAIWLADPLQPAPLAHSELIRPHARAIVILSGGNNYLAPEYGTVTLSNTNLTRLRYGAYLAKKSQLPILISGASISQKLPADAQTMAKTLSQIWHIKARWIESRSFNTAENARYSSAILKKNHIHTIWLVTSATHMRRATLSFQNFGIQVIPAATDYIGPVTINNDLFNLTPRASAFIKSYLSCYEYIGLIWYQLLGRFH